MKRVVASSTNNTLQQIAEMCKPEYEGDIELSVEVDNDAPSVDISCMLKPYQDFDEDDLDEDLDEYAIQIIEEWVNNIIDKLKSGSVSGLSDEEIQHLIDYAESELEMDWYSGMSLFGEHGPFTYDGFTFYIGG